MTPVILDSVVLAVLFFSTLFAYGRGMIREVFTILGFAVAAFGSWKGGYLLIPYFQDWLGVTADGGAKAAEAVSLATGVGATKEALVEAAQKKAELFLGIISPGLLSKICAYGAAFIAISLVMSLIGFVIRRSVEEMGLSFIDKLGGAAFGLLRGLVFIFLPYVFFAVLVGYERFPAWAANSTSVPLMQKAYAYVDAKFDLGALIDSQGDALILKLDSLGLSGKPKEEEPKEDLQDAIQREEQGASEVPVEIH